MVFLNKELSPEEHLMEESNRNLYKATEMQIRDVDVVFIGELASRGSFEDSFAVRELFGELDR